MDPKFEELQLLTRRSFLGAAGRFSLGAIALASLCGGAQNAGATSVVTPLNPLAPKKPQFQPKVKRVVYLHMSGGPPAPGLV